MLKKKNSHQVTSKDFSQCFIKAIVLVVLVVSTLGISGCSAKLMSSKKQHSENEGYAIKELIVNVNGDDLYCKIIGNGLPILFIHGGPGLVHNYFLPYMESLLPYGYQLILYDQRGNGKSTANDMDSIKMEVFVEDIESIRKKLGLDKFVLLGHSFGGYLAYMYALKYPQHVDAFIGCDVGPLTDTGFLETSSNWNKQLEQIDIKTIRALPGMNEAAKDMDDESLRNTAYRFFDKTKVADFILNSRTDLLNNERGQEIRNRIYRELNERLFNLKEYPTPKIYSLFIHGDDDPIPIWAIEQWVNIFDARLEIISKSNHFPFVEKTDEVSNLINEFLRTKKGSN